MANTPPKILPSPDWKDALKGVLKDRLGAKSAAYKRALEIIDRPEVDKAREILNRRWRTGEYPHIAELVYICAWNTSSGDESLPPILTDKAHAATREMGARDILLGIQAVKKVLPDTDGIQGTDNVLWRITEMSLGSASRGKGIRYTPRPEIKDKAVLDALLLAKDFLGVLARTPHHPGRPENLPLRNILALMVDAFRRDFRKPLHHVVALLWDATFPPKGKARTSRDVVDRLREYSTE